MKLSNFKMIYLCLLICQFTFAENNEKENVVKKTFLNKLIPKYTKIQYAGAMGLLSIGGGWVYGKKHWETDLLTGFAPTESERPTLFTLTLKQNYIPWWINLSENISVEPLYTGFYINAILNDSELFAKNPDRYPKGYYWHSERFRFNIFLGQRLKYNFHTNKYPVKSISAFYEVSTCDLYLTKIITDNYLKPKDYLSFSVGLRFGI